MCQVLHIIHSNPHNNPMKEAVVLLPFGSYGKGYREVNLPRLT